MGSPSSLQLLKAFSIFGATCLVAACPAIAQDKSSQLPELGKTLSDDELGEMRGKFIQQGSVSFFGITLLTSWQDAQGFTTNARLVFSVDFLNRGADGKPKPALMIGWERSGDPSMDVTDTHSGYVPYLATANILPVGGLGTHQGAAQANIIAGADNFARNNMTIAIVPASAVPALSTANLQNVAGSRELGFADGDQLQFTMDNNQIGIVMKSGDGLDSSLQSLGGDLGLMLQQTMLSSDGNAVLNSASIVFAADNYGRLPSFEVDNALSVMKGHGF